MNYGFKLVGTMPMLMHADDVLAADEVIAWRKAPCNKNVLENGDDRSPPWTWQAYLYSDGEHVAMPQENIMAALRHAGAKIKVKGKLTLKSLSQTGILIDDDFCRFESNGDQIAIEAIKAFRNRPFTEHMIEARKLGFDLFVKRAKIQSQKHVRVRPKFNNWSVSGTLTVKEPAITEAKLTELFELTGEIAGLGDWRPSVKEKPGPFGTFKSTITAM